MKSTPKVRCPYCGIMLVVRHEHENDANEALRWHFLDMPDCNRQEKLRIAALEMLLSERSIFRN